MSLIDKQGFASSVIYSECKQSLQDTLFRITYKGARIFDDNEELEMLKKLYPERFAECEYRYERGTL